MTTSKGSSSDMGQLSRSGEAIARRFHEAYERLSQQYGYTTRVETRQFDPDSPNGRLMIAVCEELFAASEKQAPITDNDKRWRFLEHGCQWVSFTPIGGETRSFDPRIVSGYAGHLGDMRETVDREADKHLAILREGVNATKR